MKVQYEESLLMWDWKERDLASKQLKQLVKTLQRQESSNWFVPFDSEFFDQTPRIKNRT
jgi:hypothetical protein